MKKIAVLFGLFLMMCMSCALAEPMQIVATGFPCYDFARQVAGESADVTMLIRPGVEVHSYEPSPSDILTIGQADMLVCIGGESDVWVDDILASFGENAPVCVRLMDAAETLETSHEGHDHHHHHHDHSELSLDEHIWTSPRNAVRMVRAVEDALSEQMPDSAEIFHSNADAYAAEIEAIDAELESIVEEGARHKLVFADRFPFLYMAHDYGFEYAAAFTSCAAETEPSAHTLVHLIETIRENEIPVVYTIEMSNGAIARTLAEETGAEILEMHSVQTVTRSEFNDGETYVSLMKKNLEAIRKGLN